MTKIQDFSKKIVIVVRRDLESWQVLNTVGHISAYFGNQLKDDFDTGDSFVSKDGTHHPRNSQYPIVVLSAEEKDLYPLTQEIKKKGLMTINFIRGMIDIAEDLELEKDVLSKRDIELDYLGIGVFGIKTLLKKSQENLNYGTKNKFY